MSHLLQVPWVVAVSCFCMLQFPSAGFAQPSADPPDGLDIVKLEWLAYCLNQWATFSNQPKDNQDVHKRFLFHYPRTQEPTYPVENGLSPVHLLMHLAAKLASRKTERLLQSNPRSATLDFTKKDPTAALRQPYFLFRARNGRNVEDKAP